MNHFVRDHFPFFYEHFFRYTPGWKVDTDPRAGLYDWYYSYCLNQLWFYTHDVHEADRYFFKSTAIRKAKRIPEMFASDESIFCQVWKLQPAKYSDYDLVWEEKAK